MTGHPREALLHRHTGNPILTAAQWPYPVNSVFNPAATKLPDGTTALLCRVEGMNGHSHLCLATSRNGIDGWRIDAQPTLAADVSNHPEELWGVEDPRITRLDEIGKYAVTFTAYSQGGPCVSLALTEDLRSYERLGVVLPPDNKDAALLPRRINGRWALVHRPATALGANMWIAYSDDLVHWGGHRVIMEARLGGWWDAGKIGLATAPIETGDGWLVIYHGTRVTASGSLYRLGLALFDRDDPERLLLRGDNWVLAPEEPYERIGDVGGVVFACGHTVADDGERLNIYYGGADSCIALTTGQIPEMLDWLRTHGSPTDQ
ncbi:MAG: glycosidase [Planctomycetes bacterium]|nr:glycosidase [Planctomycetota bacterium]